MISQNDMTENQTESKPIAQEKRSVKTRVFNIACLILFAAGIVFLICYYDQFRHVPVINYHEAIVMCALGAVVTIALCFLTSQTKLEAFKVVTLIIAGIVLAAGWYIYFRYIPKFGALDGCAIVNADPKYASVTVEPQYYERQEFPNIRFTAKYKIEDNPFYEWGYVLDVISDGKVIANIVFDSGSGKYEVIYESKD